MLARSKLNTLENIILKTLKDNEITHDEFATITDKERNYCKLKEIIRMLKSEKSDIEINKLIEEGKRMWIDEIIEQSQRINNNL